MLKEISLFIGKKLVENLAESFTDNVLKKQVQPSIGSVVYCELVFDVTGHSGIYVGGDTIIHLDGSGIIEAVSPKEFLNRLDGLNSAISVYVSCKDGEAVGSIEAKTRAKKMLDESIEYNLLLNNCHMFTSGCLDGEFENKNILLEHLKENSIKCLDANEWLVWEL